VDQYQRNLAEEKAHSQKLSDDLTQEKLRYTSLENLLREVQGIATDERESGDLPDESRDDISQYEQLRISFNEENQHFTNDKKEQLNKLFEAVVNEKVRYQQLENTLKEERCHAEKLSEALTQEKRQYQQLEKTLQEYQRATTQKNKGLEMLFEGENEKSPLQEMSRVAEHQRIAKEAVQERDTILQQLQELQGQMKAYKAKHMIPEHPFKECEKEINVSTQEKEESLTNLQEQLTQKFFTQIRTLQEKMERDRVEHEKRLKEQEKIFDEERLQWKNEHSPPAQTSHDVNIEKNHDIETLLQQTQHRLQTEEKRSQHLLEQIENEKIRLQNVEQSLQERQQHVTELVKERDSLSEQYIRISEQLQEREDRLKNDLAEQEITIWEEASQKYEERINSIIQEKNQEIMDLQESLTQDYLAQVQEFEEQNEYDRSESDHDRKTTIHRKEEELKFLKDIQTKKFNEAMRSNERKADELDTRERKIKENEQHLRLSQRQQLDNEKRFLETKKKVEDEKLRAIREQHNYKQLSEECKKGKLEIQKELEYLTNESHRAEQFSEKVEHEKKKLREIRIIDS